MTTASGKVEWVEKKRKLWSEPAGVNKMMSHMRLNIIDEYNQHMKHSDIAVQLWSAYCSHHWMRNRKWWWALFLWGLSVAQVNAFRIFCEMHEDARKRSEQGCQKSKTL